MSRTPRLITDLIAVGAVLIAALVLTKVRQCDRSGGDAAWAIAAFGMAAAGAALPMWRRSPLVAGGLISAMEGIIQIGGAAVVASAVVALLTTLGGVSCTG